MDMVYCGTEKEAIPVKATTITMIGEAIPALVAASPITKAPTMLTADPIWRGRLAIGDVLIPLRRHDPLAGTIGVALRARGFARAAAQRLLR